MREDLRNELQNWVNGSDKIQKRSIDQYDVIEIPGEYILSLKKSCMISIGEDQKLIFVKKIFITHGQNNNGNSNGDIFRLKDIIKRMDNEFHLAYEEAVNSILANYNFKPFI